MLMRYAEHLGGGEGIVWNVGQPPVDGATDFLFMALVGSMVRLGLPLEAATRSLSLVAHGLTLALLSVVFYQQEMPAWLASASILFVGTGGGLFYAEAFFGTPLVALLALGAWIAALRLRDHPEDRLGTWLFGGLSLLTGLARPEGVFLCGFMWLAIVWWHRDRLERIARPSAVYLGSMIGPGGAYFLWHWWYFGHPLPNPFYVKGRGFYPTSLVRSVASVALTTWPFLLALVPSLQFPQGRKHTTFLAIPVVGFACMWVLLTDEMNYFARFQYVLVPMVAVTWYPALHWFLRDRGWIHRIDDARSVAADPLPRIVAACGLLALVSQYGLFAGRVERNPDGRQEIGAALKRYRAEDHVLAVAEAGLLPLYSEWPAVDAWGLNDSHIAHEGLSEEYLDHFKPAIVMYHAHKSPVAPIQEPSGMAHALRWARMVDQLDAYVAKRPYRLAAAFGVQPHEAHYYFVRQDLPDADKLFDLIAHFRYTWPETGEVAKNFAFERTEATDR